MRPTRSYITISLGALQRPQQCCHRAAWFNPGPTGARGLLFRFHHRTRQERGASHSRSFVQRGFIALLQTRQPPPCAARAPQPSACRGLRPRARQREPGQHEPIVANEFADERVSAWCEERNRDDPVGMYRPSVIRRARSRAPPRVRGTPAPTGHRQPYCRRCPT